MMKTMKELFETAKKTMEEKQDLVFVTTISSSGSSPRELVPKCWFWKMGNPMEPLGAEMWNMYPFNMPKRF